MLYKAKTIKAYQLNCLDGKFVMAEEFYFDDKHRTIRYLVVNTGNFLTDRHVLIPPYAIDSVDKTEQLINLNVTKKKLDSRPSWDSDKPVSRQFEVEYHDYFGWTGY
ncbi:MAG: hypothetical protein A2Y40_05885 [Candidatus Margulisbacteria bacterium GWF2_35_9]|nr:MAG: hypothetical protein A2Y40_05885 [Candidatus Margulisbacteria bacterium GWF2_35_9]